MRVERVISFTFFLGMLDEYMRTTRARFTKYLTTILRLSDDNGEVTVDLTTNVQFTKHFTKNAVLFLGTIHLQDRRRLFVINLTTFIRET